MARTSPSVKKQSPGTGGTAVEMKREVYLIPGNTWIVQEVTTRIIPARLQRQQN
jgi:hypothetical protein